MHAFCFSFWLCSVHACVVGIAAVADLFFSFHMVLIVDLDKEEEEEEERNEMVANLAIASCKIILDLCHSALRALN